MLFRPEFIENSKIKSSACADKKVGVGDHSSITSAKRWVGGGGQMLIFTDKVGGWALPWLGKK